MIYDNKSLAQCFFGDFSIAEPCTKVHCKACGKAIKKPKRLDIPQDWKHEKSDEEAEEDDRDELNDEIEYAQRLSADPLPIMHGGRILWQGEPR